LGRRQEELRVIKRRTAVALHASRCRHRPNHRSIDLPAVRPGVSPHPSTLQSPWIVSGDATRAAWLSHVGVYRSSQLHSLACSVSCLVYQRAAWSPIVQCDCDSQSYIRSTSIDHASVAAVTILSHCFRLRSDRVDNRRLD